MGPREPSSACGLRYPLTKKSLAQTSRTHGVGRYSACTFVSLEYRPSITTQRECGPSNSSPWQGPVRVGNVAIEQAANATTGLGPVRSWDAGTMPLM